MKLNFKITFLITAYYSKGPMSEALSQKNKSQVFKLLNIQQTL